MEAKVYKVTCLAPQTDPQEIDWSAVPAAAIDTYKWLDGGCEPAAYGQLVFIPGKAFVVRMHCAETDPKRIYREYNEPVYTDSCLEFFAAWVAGDGRYVNMEMNALGTLLSCIGEGRGARKPVMDAAGTIPAVTGTLSADGWTVVGVIPVDFLSKLYGVAPDTFAPGYTFRGNFYKCGDDTPIPHYGMWNPVDLPSPDFHRPEFFGEFVIGE